MKLRALTIPFLLCVAPLSGAVAVEFHHPERPFVAVHNCTCRFNGEEVPLGERRCLKTSEGPKTAQCVLEQNVTSWRLGRDSCPQALNLRTMD